MQVGGLTPGFRHEVRSGDIESVRCIVSATGFFTEEEIAVAMELVETALSDQASSPYRFLFAETEPEGVVGYTCFGRIPCTASSFDLYWIAVTPACQGRGIGKALMGATEEVIRGMGGERIYIETASRALYRPTRLFYERCGYVREAMLADFYSRGDGKVIYVKRL